PGETQACQTSRAQRLLVRRYKANRLLQKRYQPWCWMNASQSSDDPSLRLILLNEITPLIITFDEAANIARTLARLKWARRIVVIDSGSTDHTIEIVRSYPQADLFHRPFDDFASQCNFGLGHVTTPWVLSLDADYELSQELVDELSNRHTDSTTA